MGKTKKLPGGRKPLPDHKKRRHTVATKLNDMEYQIFKTKAKEASMTEYEYLKQALINGEISARSYDEVVEIINDPSDSSLMRLLIIKSTVQPRITKEEVDVLKDFSMNFRNYKRNIRELAIKATLQTDSQIDYVKVVNEELEWLSELKDKYYTMMKQ